MTMLIQKPKKFRKREGDGGGSVSAVLLPHELVVEELLTRLPAKSLMPFKCVSKLWHSTITDPSFCKAHRSRSRSRPGLLLVCPEINSSVVGLRFRFFLCPNYGAGVSELLHQFTIGVKGKEEKAIDRWNKYGGVTEVVNGLFCIYTDCAARIVNVSTCEIMDLPSPPRKIPKSFVYVRYYLGFDLAHSEYKLLKVCSLQRLNSTTFRWILECDILTLGKDAAWRSVQFVRGLVPDITRSVYIHAHGARYWWNTMGSDMIAFSFKDEIFQRLAPQPPNPCHTDTLRQFGDYLAVVTGVVDRKLKLWVLDKPLTHESGCPWTPHLIHIPYDFADHGCSFPGNLPTGEMLMTSSVKEGKINSSSSSSPNHMSVYSYNPTQGRFEKMVTPHKFPSSLASDGKDSKKLCIYYHEEDITPLNHLISNKVSPIWTRDLDMVGLHF